MISAGYIYRCSAVGDIGIGTIGHGSGNDQVIGGRDINGHRWQCRSGTKGSNVLGINYIITNIQHLQYQGFIFGYFTTEITQ